MKKLCLILINIIFIGSIYPQQTGTQLIYNSGNYGIALCNSIKPNGTGVKSLYIQLGLYNYQNGLNESGKYLKLNKSAGIWYTPHNGFINANWGVYYPYGNYDCTPIPFFNISAIDSNQITKFSITAAAECPDAKTYCTINSGINYIMTPFNCGGVIFFPFGGDYNPKRISTLIYGYALGPAGYNPAIYISTNAGNNWTLLTNINGLRECSGNYYWSTYKYGFIKYNPFDTSFVYANGINSIYISTNGGCNFSNVNVNWFKDLIFSYKDSILYGFNSYRLYRSSNKGLTWDSVITQINFLALEVNPDLPNILYAGDSLGVYRSTNYGLNWVLYNNSFTPSKKVIGISKDQGSLDTFFVVTDKNVYKVWAPFIVEVKNTNNKIPIEYSLEQNYPNPFNPTTNIRFHILNSGYVKLTVYDALGKEIEVLLNSKLDAGNYEVKFYAEGLPSGIYYYRMETDNFSDTKKMILLK